MTVFQVRNAQAIRTAPFTALFERSFEGFDIDAKESQAWIADQMDDPELAVFVALREGHLQGLLVLYGATTPFCPRPWAAFLGADATPARRALVREGCAWFAGRGHTRFWALNRSGASDAAWARIFGEAGEPSRVASLFEFDMESLWRA